MEVDEVDKADMDSGGGDMNHQRTPKKPGIKLVYLKRRLPPRKDVLDSCKTKHVYGILEMHRFQTYRNCFLSVGQLAGPLNF